MPVLDLDEFLKRNASREFEPAKAPSEPAAQPTLPAPPKLDNPSGGIGFEVIASRVDQLLSFKTAAEGRLGRTEEDIRLVKLRLADLAKGNTSALAKADQAIAVLSELEPASLVSKMQSLKAQADEFKAFRDQLDTVQRSMQVEVEELKAKSSLAPSLPPMTAEVGATIHKLERDLIENAAHIRTLEVASAQVKEWVEREKDYFIKTDEVAIRMTDLERKVASNPGLTEEQVVPRSQFDKYVRMADLERHQLKISYEEARELVAGISASIERLNSLVRSPSQSAGSSQVSEAAQAKLDYLESRLSEQAKTLDDIRAQSGSDALERYSKELEKTHTEVAANYEQVKGVEKLLAAQSQKMQDVFAEIQKNLSEFKTTSDMLNSTHDAVLHDIGSLKSEHERGITEYHQLAMGLEQKVSENVKAVAELRRALDNLMVVEGIKRRLENDSLDRANLPSLTERLREVEHTIIRLSEMENEQKLMREDSKQLNNALVDVTRRISTLRDEALTAAKSGEGDVESIASKVGQLDANLSDTQASSSTLFTNIAGSLKELRGELERTRQDGEGAHTAMQSLGRRISEIEAAVAKQRASPQELQAITSQLSQAAPSGDAAAAKFAEYVTSLSTLSAELSSLRAEVENNPASGEQVRREVSNAISGIDSKYSGALGEYESRFSSLSQKMNMFGSSIDSLKSSISSLDSFRSSMKASVERLSSDTTRLDYVRDDLRREMAGWQQSVEAKFVSDLQLAESRLSGPAKSAQAKIESLYSELSKLPAFLDSRFSETAQTFDSKMTVAMAKAERAEKAAALSQKAGDAVRAELAVVKESLGGALPDALSKISGLDAKYSSELKNHEAKLAEVSQKIAAMQPYLDPVSGLRQNVDSLSGEVARIGGVLKANESKVDTVYSEIAKLPSVFDARFTASIAAFDSKVGPLAEKADRNEKAFTLMQKDLSEIKESAVSEVSRISERLERTESTTRWMADEFKAFKAVNEQAVNETAAFAKRNAVEWTGRSAELDGRLNDLSSRHISLESKMLGEGSALSQLSQRVEDLGSSLAQQRATLDSVAGLQKSSVSATQRTSDELIRYEQESSAAIAELRNHVNSLLVKGESRRLEEEAQDLYSQALEKLSAAEQAVQQISPAMARVEELQTQLVTERAQMREVVSELRQYKNDVASRSFSAYHQQVIRERGEEGQPPSEKPASAPAAEAEKAESDEQVDRKLAEIEKALGEIEASLKSATFESGQEPATRDAPAKPKDEKKQ